MDNANKTQESKSNKISTFEDLEVWQNAAKIGVDILKFTDEPRFRTDFGIKDQIRRSSFSISSNIAEGFEYGNNKDFIKFLRYSKGSAGELRSQLYILFKSGIIDEEYYISSRKELLSIGKQLGGFIKYLKSIEPKK